MSASNTSVCVHALQRGGGVESVKVGGGVEKGKYV